MIRFGYLALLFSACFGSVFSQKPCDGVLGQQFRPDPADCRVYYLCGQGKDWRLQCGPNTVWNQEIGACVPVGSPEDTCTQSNKDPLPYTAPKGDPAARTPGTRHYSPFSESTWRPKCMPGSTKRFPHPTRCAQYYDCGADPKEDWWGKGLRECPYPTVYDTKTGSCEYYTSVNCGDRKMPLDPCDYLAHSCRNAHCSPCHIRYATCAGLPDGINVWRGREKTPFYVVCQAQRVAFHGRCINPEPGKRQVYDGEFHTCGRPIDFEMGLVHHMHRGEIGQSQIVKQIRHTKQVTRAQSAQVSQPPSPTGQTQPSSSPHVNQPKPNSPPQQSVNNNNQPAAPNQQNNQPKPPTPHVNQPQNNQQKQTAPPPANNAANSQANKHTPHVNQPKTAAPQSNTQAPSGQPSHHTQAPVQSAPHANQPAKAQSQPPVQHPAAPQKNYQQPPPQPQQPYQQPPPQPQQPYQQPPPQPQQPYQQPPSQPQYGPPQGPPQGYGPQNNPPRPPQPQGPNVPPQPHVNQPPVHQQRSPYAQPQNKPPTQNPNSLQSFIGEIQHKVMSQQPSVPQPHPNQPSSLQVVRAKPGRRPPFQNYLQPVQPVQPMPPRQPPVQHQPVPSYPLPQQQRQPSYPHVPQHAPQQRPPSPPVAGPPVPSGPNPIHHPNMPQTVQRPYPVPQQPYPIPNRQHGPPPAPVPQQPQQRMYPQPIPRAPSHGPQPIQPRPIGPYPQPQLYNEPSTLKQSISPKNNNLETKRYPVPPTQVSRVFHNHPYWREVVVSEAKREKIADIKATQVPAQQSIHSKSDRAMERYSSHILGLNEVFEKNAKQPNTAHRPEETLQHLRQNNQNQHNQQPNANQHHLHPNKPNYQQQQQPQNQQHTQNQLNSQQQLQAQQQQSAAHFNLAQQHNVQSHQSPGFHPNQPTQQSLLSNMAQHQQFQQRAMQQLMNISPTQAYLDQRFQTHQNPVGSSYYMQAPTPTILSNYLPASTARTAILNNRFTIQSGLATSRLSQGAEHTFSQSLSNPSQFAMPNVA